MTCPMTIAEVAKYLRVSESHVGRMCAADGGIPHIRLGLGKRAPVIIDKPDLDAWLEDHKKNSFKGCAS